MKGRANIPVIHRRGTPVQAFPLVVSANDWATPGAGQSPIRLLLGLVQCYCRGITKGLSSLSRSYGGHPQLELGQLLRPFLHDNHRHEVPRFSVEAAFLAFELLASGFWLLASRSRLLPRLPPTVGVCALPSRPSVTELAVCA